MPTQLPMSESDRELEQVAGLQRTIDIFPADGETDDPGEESHGLEMSPHAVHAPCRNPAS